MFFVAILASAAALGCCFLWLLTRNEAISLQAKLEYAKTRMMPEDQLKEAQKDVEAMRRQFKAEVEKELMSANAGDRQPNGSRCQANARRRSSGALRVARNSYSGRAE